MPRASKRDDVRRAAEACFYEFGIAATGVDLVAERAQVSKRTLYNHFASKTDLVEDYLRSREQRWRARAERILASGDDPLDVLRAYARAYVTHPELTPGENYRGCAFINAAAELDDDDPALAVIVASKDAVVDDVEGLLRRSGHPTPDTAARTIGLLLEGACARAGVHRDGTEASELLAGIETIAGAGST